MKLIIICLFLILCIISNVLSVSINTVEKYSIRLLEETTVEKKHHHHESSSSDSIDDSDSDSGNDGEFQSGNILITDPTSLNPVQFYEFSTDGDSIYNYTTYLQGNHSERCVPVDMGFIDSSNLLLLDSHQGIFLSTSSGQVKGYWNNLKTNTKNKLGCGLTRMNVDTVNQKVYVSSVNLYCDFTYAIGIFVYGIKGGELQEIITNPQFNTTTGIAGDSQGNIWITDINEIFVYNPTGKSFKTYSPISSSDRIAYNGITISENDEIYISVPSYKGDMIIQITTSGSIVTKIPLIGLFNGLVSGLPGSLALTKNHIYVEVPYASKKEAPPSSSGSESSSDSSSSEWEQQIDQPQQAQTLLSSDSSHKQKVDIIQSYNLQDGSFDKSWGGHSCNPKNILCIPNSGFIIVP